MFCSTRAKLLIVMTEAKNRTPTIEQRAPKYLPQVVVGLLRAFPAVVSVAIVYQKVSGIEVNGVLGSPFSAVKIAVENITTPVRKNSIRIPNCLLKLLKVSVRVIEWKGETIE